MIGIALLGCGGDIDAAVESARTGRAVRVA